MRSRELESESNICEALPQGRRLFSPHPEADVVVVFLVPRLHVSGGDATLAHPGHTVDGNGSKWGASCIKAEHSVEILEHIYPVKETRGSRWGNHQAAGTPATVWDFDMQ